MGWLGTEGVRIEEACARELMEDIKVNLDEFSLALAKARSNMRAAFMSDLKDASFEGIDFMGDALAGAGGGGVLGYAAMFVAQRFAPAIFGPAGWIFVLGTSAFTAILALLGKSDGGAIVKKKYLAQSQSAMRDQAPAQAAELARAAGLKFREGLLGLAAGLAERVGDARKPRERAMKALEGEEAEIEAKKARLAAHREKFSKLAAEARDLRASI